MGRLLAVAAAALAVAVQAASRDAWPASAYAQANATLAKMTLAEKLSLVHGYGGSYVGDVPATTNFPVPQNLEDGPQGVADGVTQVTAWPSALTVTMSWDVDAMYAFGFGMGTEQRAKGTNIMLGPGVNLQRVPWGGRTFEYVGGEDPFLAATMVAPEIAGIQANNISANVKHFVCNNQEYDRFDVSENVPKRAFMELYTRAFQSAVDAGVGSLMCSYNRINNTYACENPTTLAWLKEEAGYDGAVISDWGATHSTINAALSGLDQQMPDSSYFGYDLANAVANGSVPVSRIDDMVSRLLVPFYALNLFANPPTGNLSANVTSDAHNTLARTLAEESITLLKNTDGLLPVNPKSVKNVVVMGDESTVHGYGSGGVIPPYIITPFEGVFQYLNGVPLPPRPLNCSFVYNTDFYQPGNPSVGASDPSDCCAKCTATAGCNAFTFVPGTSGDSGGTCWLKPDNSGAKASTNYTSGTCAAQPIPSNLPYNVTYNSGQNATTAAQAAAGADLVIVSVAVTSSEGSDRVDLTLPDWQNALVSAVTAVQKNTIVVVRCPGACMMTWVDQASTILYQLMPGQEAGNALANTIFGDNIPGGKLPVSFPNNMSDTWLGNPINPEQYPGTDRGLGWIEADYTEDLLFGYRWYDSQDITPLWPFGHGLSYSTWTYSNLQVSGTLTATQGVNVSVTVTNNGPYVAHEVPQLYLGFPAAADEPPKLLRGFSKVKNVPVGSSSTVTFPLDSTSVRIWDVIADNWSVVPGTYQVLVGSSSRDIRLTGSLTVTA